MESATLSEALGGPPMVQRAAGRPEALGRIGSLEARLARSADEVAAAQEVRFRVFHDEFGAGDDDAERRDRDRFDAVCEHLLVFDTALPGPDHKRVVGTYRLLPQERAREAGGFYSEAEFELATLIMRHPGRRFLELGRSCVMPEYRIRRTVELLWQGVWAYCRQRDVDVMLGCASFAGVIPAAHAQALSFLTHFRRAEGGWRIRALPHRYHTMDLMPAEAMDVRAAIGSLPPLIKGYLRLGARFGEGCVIDPHFRTTDVFVVLPVEAISERYIAYYGADAERFAVAR